MILGWYHYKYIYIYISQKDHQFVLLLSVNCCSILINFDSEMVIPIPSHKRNPSNWMAAKQGWTPWKILRNSPEMSRIRTEYIKIYQGWRFQDSWIVSDSGIALPNMLRSFLNMMPPGLKMVKSAHLGENIYQNCGLQKHRLIAVFDGHWRTAQPIKRSGEVTGNPIERGCVVQAIYMKWTTVCNLMIVSTNHRRISGYLSSTSHTSHMFAKPPEKQWFLLAPYGSTGFHIHRASAGIPIIFMTSLMRASLSSTKLFMIRVKGQMKTKTSGQSRCEDRWSGDILKMNHLDFTGISPEFRVQRGSFSKCVWLKPMKSNFWFLLSCLLLIHQFINCMNDHQGHFPNETNSIQ